MPASKKISLTNSECSLKCRSKKDAAQLISRVCRSGDLESLFCLATTGICSNPGRVTDHFGRSLVHLAASVGKPMVLEWLIKYKNGQINAKDAESGYSALTRAVFHGQIHIAKLLVSNYGANLSVLDHDGLTPLDHFSIDRGTLPKTYNGHWGDTNVKRPTNCDVYVWGSNTTYNLGLGHQQPRSIPDINEYFRKDNIKVKDVKLSKFHSAFVATDGQVYTCGHGHGGRLGHGHEESLLHPKAIKCLSEFKITDVSLGIDHTLFLTSNGQVLACGLNAYQQVGIGPKDSSNSSSYSGDVTIKVPVMLNSAKSKLPMAKGIATSKFHSLFWTSDSLYTWGLNGGQLGHLKHEKSIPSPKLVSSMKGRDDINLVSSSDGAIVILTKNGDLMILYDYNVKKVASRQNDVVKIEAIGGHLDPKAISSKAYESFTLVEKGGQDLKIFVLNAIGRIFVWQEKNTGGLVQCLFAVSREIWVKDFAVHRNGLCLISREGSAYDGIHHQSKAASASNTSGSSNMTTSVAASSNNQPLASSVSSSGHLYKFVDKEQCDSIRIKRLPLIHRGIRIAVDPKGNNVCVLQTQPNTELNDLPWIQPRSLSRDLLELYPESTLKDLTLKVHSKLFSVHRYILAASSSKMAKIIMEDHVNDTLIDLSEYTEIPEIFEQVIRYAYYQDCDMMKEGVLPFKVISTQHKQQHCATSTREFSITEMQQNSAAYQVYAKNNSTTNTSNSKKNNIKNSNNSSIGNNENNNNILVQLQDLAKRLGFHDMVKASILSPTVKKWSRTKFEALSDVIIVTEDNCEFRAHKCILSARLDYFRSMFSMGWIESNPGNSQKITQVKLPITGPLCQILLDYLYTDMDVIPNSDAKSTVSEPEFLCNVLVMADQLLIPRLIQVCEKHLVSLLTLKNVGEILQFAHDFNAQQLLKCCKDFVCYNLGALIEGRALDVVDVDVLKNVSQHYQSINRALSSRMITPYSYGPTTEEIEAVAASVELTKEELYELEAEQFSLQDISTTSSGRKKRARKLSTGSNSSNGQSSDSETDNVQTMCNNLQIKNRSSHIQHQQTLDHRLYRASQYVEEAEAEIDILEDLEQLNVKTTNDAYDDDDDSAFIIIESKSGAKDNVIESFFNDPKKFTKSPPRLQSSAVDSSSSSFKKFNKLSQKERKKQQKQQHNEKTLESPSSIGITENQKPKWNGWGSSNTSSSSDVLPNVASINSPQKQQQQPRRDNGSTSPESLSLASIMQIEEKSNSGGKSNKNSYNRSNSQQVHNQTQQMGSISSKRTRKPSWKSLSFTDEPMTSPTGAASIMATSPPNPWKIIPQPRQIEQKSEIVGSFQEILREENEQSQNLTRARSKPFNVTQLEESAIQELQTFYNVDSVFDEFITVERVEQGVLATPIWRKRKPSTG